MGLKTRVLQKIFGSTGGTSEFGQIGSDAAGSPTTSKDLDTIQALSEYLLGLYAITDNANEPPRIQDINSLNFLTTSQLSYLFQSGIPEYLATEEYFQNISIVQVAGAVYLAITGTDLSPNLGNDPTTSPANWRLLLDSDGSNKGLYTGEGISYDGSQYIVLDPYEIKAGNRIYKDASPSNVVDLTGLIASTWYAVVINENDGTVSSVPLGSGWDNLTISGNQLNMASIYNKTFDYCRDSRTSIFYRIVGVFKTNSTPDDIEEGLILNIINYPKTSVYCTHSTSTTTINNGATVNIDYETIEIDLNSEVTTGATWDFTPKKTGRYKIGISADLDAGSWGTNQSLQLYGQIQDSSLNILHQKQSQLYTMAGGTFRMSNGLNPPPYKINKGYSYRPLIRQNSGNNRQQTANPSLNWVTIEG